jgi:hypothetical protein
MAWALATTQPHREFAAARALTRHDFDFHLFTIRKRVAVRGRNADRFYPAFPSYLFVSASENWDFLRDRCLITSFVSRALPAGVVPALVAVADDKGCLPTPDVTSERFKTGEQVMIGGMSLLSGTVAIFQNMVDEFSAIVLVEWLGRFVPTTIDERDLNAEISSSRTRRHRRGRRRRRSAKA